MTPDQVKHAYRDIIQKRRTTKYLHMKPLLIERVPEVEYVLYIEKGRDNNEE